MSAIVQLVALTRGCRARGWLEATSGNLSVQLSEHTIAVTPSGRDKSTVRASDIAYVDYDARARAHSEKPSAETPLHASLYRALPDLNAVAIRTRWRRRCCRVVPSRQACCSSRTSS